MLKKVLPILGLIAFVAIATLASGAFTSVQAQRVAEINVVKDDVALLALSPCDGPNGAYAGYADSGALYIDLTGFADGVNTNAVTAIEDVFTITNNGTQTIRVDLEWTGDNPDAVAFDVALASSMWGKFCSWIELDVGETAVVSIWINTGLWSDDVSQGQNLINGITLTATSQ